MLVFSCLLSIAFSWPSPRLTQEDDDGRAPAATITIGILSDTHGVLDDALLDLLCAHQPAAIIHGGDIGPGRHKGKGRLAAAELVARLEAVAPVHAIAGNVDEDGPSKAALGPRISMADVVEFQVAMGLRVWLSHGHRFPIKPTWSNDDEGTLAFPAAQAEAKARIAAARPDLVVCGHTHQPIVGRLEGVVGDGGPVLFINPGSAGPQRFSLPRAFVLLSVVGSGNKKGSRPVRIDRYEYVTASAEWRVIQSHDLVI